MKPLYWKILLILGAVIVAASLVIPKTLRKNTQVNLDDITHTELILEVDEEYLVQRMLAGEVQTLRKNFNGAKIRGSIRKEDDAIIVGFRSNEYDDKGALFLENYPVEFSKTDQKNITVEKTKNRLYKLLYTQAYIDYRTIEANKQIYRAFSTHIKSKKSNFVDIKKLNTNQIRLRVASENEEQWDALLRQIRKPVRLRFHEVLRTDQEELKLCVEDMKCPLGTFAYPQKNGAGYLMLRDVEIVSNIDIKKASSGLHPQYNSPIVNFKFNSNGAKKFCEFTSAHVGEPFAVVINDEIITAPIINGAICGGSGFIEGGFTMEAAENLALALNAGTLPTRMRVVRERTVVPPGTAAPQK